MPSLYTEGGLVERPALELLGELGWTVVNAFRETFGPAGTLGRDSMRDVVLTHKLRDALSWLNPQVPEAIREEALAALAKDRSVMDRVRANREVYDLVPGRLPRRVARRGRRSSVRDDQLRRLP